MKFLEVLIPLVAAAVVFMKRFFWVQPLLIWEADCSWEDKTTFLHDKVKLDCVAFSWKGTLKPHHLGSTTFEKYLLCRDELKASLPVSPYTSGVGCPAAPSSSRWDHCDRPDNPCQGL